MRGSKRRIGQLNPLRRAGAPAETARTALFLAFDAASYVNGQAFDVEAACRRRFRSSVIAGRRRAPRTAEGNRRTRILRLI